jgi:hypothetical protein
MGFYPGVNYETDNIPEPKILRKQEAIRARLQPDDS